MGKRLLRVRLRVCLFPGLLPFFWLTSMSVSKLKDCVVLSAIVMVCFACCCPTTFAFDEKAHAEAAAPAEGHAATGGDAHGADAPHETGIPMSFQKDLALWSLVTFLCFLFVMKKFAWAPMIAGLDARESGIKRAIAEAEEGRRKSQALLAEYDQKLKAAERTVQEMVAEAKRDAERTGQDLIAAAQKEVNALRDRAKDDIRQARDSALSEVFATMNSQVLLATEHVLGRSLNDGDQDRLVSEALAGIAR